MSIKHLIKKGLKVVFAKRPIHLTAQITQLGKSELLRDRLALITGGTSGIGYAIANAMLSAGASVIITGRSEQRLGEAKARLMAVAGDRARVHPTDGQQQHRRHQSILRHYC